MTIDELQDIVQAALVAAAAIGSALVLARGRGFAPCLGVFLAVGFAAVSDGAGVRRRPRRRRHR